MFSCFILWVLSLYSSVLHIIHYNIYYSLSENIPWKSDFDTSIGLKNLFQKIFEVLLSGYLIIVSQKMLINTKDAILMIYIIAKCTFRWYKATGLCNQNHWKSWHKSDNMPPKKSFPRSVHLKIWIILLWTSAIILKEWWYTCRCKIYKCKWEIWSYCSFSAESLW